MKINRQAKSSHWYHMDGTPCHEVTAKTTGLPRPTNVADARKLNLVPSVTNVLAIKDKPALKTWLMDNSIRAALTTPRGPDEPEEVWYSRIAEEADRIGREAAEWGTLLHEQVEQLATEGAFLGTGEILEYVAGVKKWMDENVAEVVAAEKLVTGSIGYAGRLDLYAIMKNGRKAVIDFKSQKLAGKRAPNFYKEWSMQLAAYGDCLREEGAMPALISVIIPSDAPGPVFVKEWDNADKALAGFHSCHALWCFDKDYTP
jgi:hypothetical protein